MTDDQQVSAGPSGDGLAHPPAASMSARVYVLAKVSPGALEEFVRQASHMQGVARVSAVTGSFDAVVTVEDESTAKALRTVLKGILGIPGVVETQTLVEVPLE